jgi:hypothetical protein
LLSVELAARQLDEFTRDRMSLLKETKLLDFDSGEQIWPPKQPTMASVIAPVIDARRHPDDCSPDWWRPGAEAAELKRQQEQEALARAAQDKEEFYGRVRR